MARLGNGERKEARARLLFCKPNWNSKRKNYIRLNKTIFQKSTKLVLPLDSGLFFPSERWIPSRLENKVLLLWSTVKRPTEPLIIWPRRTNDVTCGSKRRKKLPKRLLRKPDDSFGDGLFTWTKFNTILDTLYPVSQLLNSHTDP